MGRGFSLALAAALMPLQALAGNCGSLLATPVKVYRSQLYNDTFDFLKQDEDIHFAQPFGANGAVFTVDPSARAQSMNGFGGAMTESCAINLGKLPDTLREQALQALFSKATGAGFDYVRMPVGASDFADGTKGSYTYDDSPNNEPDPLFLHFDLSRDEKSFAYIREARKINPFLRVMISPWSPPAWMKTPTDFKGGTLNPNYYPDYARYFVKVIQGMRQRGVPVASLTVQNEPLYPNSYYPSMGMSAKEQIRFIRDYLVPELALANLHVGIYVFDHNWDHYDYANEVLDDPAVKNSVEGIAYHCYGGSYSDMDESNKRHPEIAPFQTECSGVLGSTLKDDYDWWLSSYAIGPTNFGSRGSIAWNLCLDEKGGPTNGGCLFCGGLVTTDFSDASAPKLTYAPEYYALAQISRFIEPGSVRVGVTSVNEGLLKSTAFSNRDGSVSFVVWNPVETSMNIHVERANCSAFDYSLPAKTAVTFKWKENSPIASVAN